MISISHFALAAVLPGLAFTHSISGPARPGGPSVGDVVQYTWHTPVANGLGVSSLDDLRGKPVLIDFWGTHCPPCVGVAVPSSVKLQETFGDDLQVVFVECQGASSEQMESFSLARRWLGGRAMWTCERPCDPGAGMLPSCALLGNDGKLLLKGNPLELNKEIERQIAEQIKNRKCPPVEASACVRPAWTELNRGRIAKAFESLREAEKANDGKPEVVDAVRLTDKQFRTRVERELKRLQWLVDNGYFDETALRLDDLRKNAKGEEAISTRCNEIAVQLAAPELRSEREAARALGRLLPDFFKTGGDASTSLELQRLAEKFKGTKAGARAERWARLAQS